MSGRISSIKNLKNFPAKTPETWTYHDRPGRPIIHRDGAGHLYIMIRAKGGGRSRFYLSRERLAALRSAQGYGSRRKTPREEKLSRRVARKVQEKLKKGRQAPTTRARKIKWRKAQRRTRK